MPSILITQCLQRDFVGLVGAHDALPNRLHVGHAESQRLLGPDPAGGPVAQLMTWARARPASELTIIHVRDWHDPNDPAQRDHLAMFGPHCLRGTEGAALVLGLDEDIGVRPNVRVIDSLGLNDFEGTHLDVVLREIQNTAREPVRVGVIGVWTEAKVSFLLYDLKTRFGIDQLATCSALTASASRAQHFNSLEQLTRILGVQCFDSVGDLASWLGRDGGIALAPPATRFGPRAEISGGPPLHDNDRDILGFLYRDSVAVDLEPLSGGFSGASVFRATSRDALGHVQAPSVVKVGPRAMIATERVAFERVEEILGNNAPSVRGFVDFGERAGIKYSYAAMGQGKVRTFKSLWQESCTPERADEILRATFGEILAPLYSAARYQRLPLAEHYRFSPAFAPSVRNNVERIVGRERADDDRLTFSADYDAANLCAFYEQFLSQDTPAAGGEFHYVAYGHGDLNAANILVDGRENVWLIDFFHTAPAHVLKDLAKLENDLLYILTPIDDEATFTQALRITRALRSVEDLRSPLPESLPGVDAPALVRAWGRLRLLRSFAAELCRDDRHPLQMSWALLRYAAHTLSFDESSPLQKRWALAASCGLAEDIMRTVRTDRVLRIDWIDEQDLGGPGRLGLTLCPGRRDRGRDLTLDLTQLAQAGVRQLLSLPTEEELAWAGVADLGAQARAHGIEHRHLPLPDQAAPGHDDLAALIPWIEGGLDRGDNVVVHCLGGLGRAGTIAACVLVARGLSAQDAIAAVRRCRGPRAVETEAQRRFVEDYARARG